MNTTATRFLSAVVGAFPKFLDGRLIRVGVTSGMADDAVAAATGRLRTELEALLSLPFDRQAESPIEVVRRATMVVTSTLHDLGVPPPDRDAHDEGIAPDDIYGLGPASAAELGDDALQASLEWGLAKTAALTRPTLLVVTTNLMDGSRFDAAAAAQGYRVETSRDGAAATTPLVAFVDLESRSSDDAIRSLSSQGVRVIAYGPHVDDTGMVRALSLGASAAEPRSRMFRDPGAFLRPVV